MQKQWKDMSEEEKLENLHEEISRITNEFNGQISRLDSRLDEIKKLIK